MPTIGERFKRSWNAFIGRDPTTYQIDYAGTSYRPDKRYLRSNAQSILGFVYNRIAVDVASVDIRHVRVDENGSYKETIDSYLNDCFSLEANLDQSGRAFIQDAAMSMFDEGVVALVPTDCEVNKSRTEVEGANVYSLRTGRIVTWYPTDIKVDVYNERSGKREEIIVPKTLAAIIENPFYSLMNEPNSTLQRLLRTIADLNVYNGNNTSGKLDLIIQLPYVIKTELRKREAEKRRKELEDQLNGSTYGVAYADGTERIIQLNRSLENNLWAQVKELTEQLYNQLGITASIFDGTADEATMINYYNRTIEPVVAAICDDSKRKFLSRTAITQGQSIKYFRDPFKLVPVSQLAEIADKLSRNEILSSNELRAEMGYKPVDNERANSLQNKNINTSNMEMENPDTFGNAGISDNESPDGSINIDDNAMNLEEQLKGIFKEGDQNE